MWIVKIGGSWIKNRKLPYLLKLFERFSNQKLIFVLGGGIFADCVREIFKNGDMSEETAHTLAVKATEINGLYVGSLNKEILIIDKIKKINKKKLNLWLPSKELFLDDSFEKNWESTSDSIATWLYSKTESKGLIYIKSLDFNDNSIYKLGNLQDLGILDLNLQKYLNGKRNLKIVGPKIIHFLENSKDWNTLTSKLKRIEL